MSSEACCTCATFLTDTKVPYDPASEKPLAFDRRLDCCNRIICAACINKNPRFESYCPYCQIATAPSALPAQGLREPPAYSPPESPRASHSGPSTRSPASSSPPAYSEFYTGNDRVEGSASQEDVVHHLRPDRDSIASVSILYRVPAPVIRKHNSLYSDHLLSARKVLFIPASHYSGPSLSAEPADSPEEAERKNKIRRFQVSAKCAEYDVAVLYLQNYGSDLGAAVDAYQEDEKWEQEHPMDDSSKIRKGKAKVAESKKGRNWKRMGIGAGVTGQLS